MAQHKIIHWLIGQVFILSTPLFAASISLSSSKERIKTNKKYKLLTLTTEETHKNLIERDCVAAHYI
jgi:hypothetical protein